MNENLAEYVALVNKCDDLFHPDVFLKCEKIPIRESANNKTKFKIINELNKLISCKYGTKDGKFVVLELNTIIRNAPNFFRMKHYNQLYHDNLHPNYITELPTL